MMTHFNGLTLHAWIENCSDFIIESEKIQEFYIELKGEIAVGLSSEHLTLGTFLSQLARGACGSYLGKDVAHGQLFGHRIAFSFRAG